MQRLNIDTRTLEKLDSIAEQSEKLNENNTFGDTIEHLANAHMIQEGFIDAENYDDKVKAKREELKAMIRGEEQDVEELEESTTLSEKQQELKDKISSGQ